MMQKSKRFGAILLALVMLTAFVPVIPAAKAATSGDWEYEVFSGNAYLDGYTGKGGDVTIPSTLGGYPVTYISWYAFYGCTSLTSVTIPNGVTSIGEFAFSGCTSLTNITIPDSVTFIGSGAFGNTGWYNEAPDGILYLDSWCLGYKGDKPGGELSLKQGTKGIVENAFNDCAGLTGVNIPNSVTEIGAYAFEGCTSLTGVNIPNGVTAISYSTFSGCESLTSITIPDSVTSIGDRAFFNTGWYNSAPDGVLYLEGWCLGYKGTEPGGELSLKQGTRGIADSALSRCTELTSIAIPDSVTSIGNDAFYYCPSLTSVTIPDSVTDIGDDAFYYCPSLTSVTIPDSVTDIGDGAFSLCESLTSVTIPGSVTDIGRYAFFYCTALTSITIPNSVTSIGDSAFSGCDSLTGITVDAGNPNYTSAEGVLFDKAKTLLIQFPGGRSGEYTIPNSVTTIGNDAFSNCKLLTDVTIGNSVTSIGDHAFSWCPSLTSVTIGNSVTSIGYCAFVDCTSLTSVTIPNSVTSIGEWAFSGCTNLTISCYSGSYAHTYAKGEGIPVKLLTETYTVKFNKNGGSGTMKNQTIDIDKSTKLTANSFTRKSYVFAGWATTKSGKVAYKNKASVKNIADSGKTITLYAQWTKVSAPTKAVTSLKLTSPKTKQIKVTYKKVSGAAGYRIQYSTSSKFTKATTKTVHTTKLTYTLKSLTAKKTYYVRVTAYKVDSTKAKIYSKKTATKNLKTK